MRRGWCRWDGRTKAEYHLILRAEVVTFILHESGICVFGQKYMSQMARVFSKLASPHEARVGSLGRQNISGVPFNIKGRSCHIYPAHKWNLCFWAEVYVSNGESVLEAGKST